MRELRKEAQKLREEKNYIEAINIYENIIDDYQNITDLWLGWEYADSLKKHGDIDKAISVCKTLYLRKNYFKHLNDLLSWCLYEKFYKEKSTLQNIKQKIEIAKFIMKIIQQDGSNTPYINIVFYMINYYKEPFNPNEVLYWLDKLDPSGLDDNAYKINNTKREIEINSRRESWYYLYCKALFKIQKYDEGIKMKKDAFKCISKFHNNHDLWLNRMEAHAYQQLGNIDKAIHLMESVLKSNNNWIIYGDIGNMNYILGKVDKAVINYSKALLIKGDESKKINILEQLGKIFLKTGKNEEGYKHFLLALKIREKEEWHIHPNLKKYIENNKEKYMILNIEKELSKIWEEQLLKQEGRIIGEIFSIAPNRKYGFIKGNKENYYFSIDSLLNNVKVYPKDKVSFILQESFDKKKNKKTQEAKEIIVLEDKNG
jgi:tetratricopeptide (TPR) repeat protein